MTGEIKCDQSNKATRAKLVMLTCYDASFAKLCAQARVDYLLVGDSAGMVLFGEKSTHHVQLSDIVRLTSSVRKGLEGIENPPLIIGDFPISTYRTADEACETAKILSDAGADILKLEGALPDIVGALKSAGYRVCAHLGLTPQTATEYRVQARKEDEANQLILDAYALEKAGAEMLVLEMIPAPLAEKITHNLKIPTIGIGAGAACSGQVLVLYDLLGLNPDFHPKFLKTYLDGASLVKRAIENFSNDVRSGQYPDREHSFQ